MWCMGIFTEFMGISIKRGKCACVLLRNRQVHYQVRTIELTTYGCVPWTHYKHLNILYLLITWHTYSILPSPRDVMILLICCPLPRGYFCSCVTNERRPRDKYVLIERTLVRWSIVAMNNMLLIDTCCPLMASNVTRYIRKRRTGASSVYTTLSTE